VKRAATPWMRQSLAVCLGVWVGGLIQVTGAIAQTVPEGVEPNSPTDPFQPVPGLNSTPVSPSGPSPENSPAAKPAPSQPNSQRQRQPLPPDEPIVSPLEITQPDPLIPFDYQSRPLTAQERRELQAAADRLAQIGASKLQQGDAIAAFEAWNRELRYRRLAGPLTAEVLALGRVGDVAWQQTNTPQLRWITLRLDQILAQTRESLRRDLPTANSDPAIQTGVTGKPMQLWEALGFAYQQVRLPKIAASIYQEVLADARQQNNANRIEAALITLGLLHLSWFDYPNAAIAYQELLERVQQRGDRYNEPIYLSQLAYIHEKNQQPAKAISYQEQLIRFYQTAGTLKPIPELMTRMADNYGRLQQLDQAERYYQEAYRQAVPLLQFGDASIALNKLGEMYRRNQRLDSAARIYTFLISVEQQAYNTYGMMTAYDQLGQIYRQQQLYPAAIAAFQNGLVVAKRLKFREDYFAQQIQQTETDQTKPEQSQ
jgi:tetratricopeptide (TPR) repeat protein